MRKDVFNVIPFEGTVQAALGISCAQKIGVMLLTLPDTDENKGMRACGYAMKNSANAALEYNRKRSERNSDQFVHDSGSAEVFGAGTDEEYLSREPA